MAENIRETDKPENRLEHPEPALPMPDLTISPADERERVREAMEEEFRKAVDGEAAPERTDVLHSRYPDGAPVYEGEQPGKIRGPDTAADGAPHTVLKMDEVNNRVYKAREYGDGGYPVRDIDFTVPTYPSGRPRPDHTAPEEHLYTPVDPANLKAGFRRGPGRPLES